MKKSTWRPLRGSREECSNVLGKMFMSSLLALPEDIRKLVSIKSKPLTLSLSRQTFFRISSCPGRKIAPS